MSEEQGYQDPPAQSAPRSPRITVLIREGSIRLGQLLKLANLVETGAEVRPLLASGAVTINGEVETRRGRQLRPGDAIVVRGEEIELLYGGRRGGPD